MVDKKDKKKKAKKTPKQKQKQKQSVVVNVNMTKPATRRRTLAKKTSDNRPLPQTPQSYGIPVQQSLQPSLNNITEYLRQKEGQENNRYVNILSAMKAIQRDEGQQGTATQSERGAGTSTQAPAAGRKKGSTKSEEEKQQARERREVKAAAKFAADLEAQYQPTATSKLEPQYKPEPTREPMAGSFNPGD